jgi:hypothetical protein
MSQKIPVECIDLKEQTTSLFPISPNQELNPGFFAQWTSWKRGPGATGDVWFRGREGAVRGREFPSTAPTTNPSMCWKVTIENY